MLQNFRLARYNFVLTALDPLLLPPYKGSTLRGVFGHAFKRIVCALQRQDCAECLLRIDCPYASVFESRPPDDADIKRLQTAIPRPFVIEPPLTEQTHFSPGDEIAFKLVLVGRAIDLLAYFVVAFQEAGRMGIGKGRGQYELMKCTPLVGHFLSPFKQDQGPELKDEMNWLGANSSRLPFGVGPHYT